MSIRRLVPLFASMVAFSFVACNDAAKAPTLSSGLPPSTQVDNLTNDQAQKLCLAFQDYANQLVGADVQKRLGCVVSGVVAQATGTTTCQSTYDTCMRETTHAGVPISLSCDAATGAVFAGCSATVQQITACANAVAATVDPLLDGLDCAAVSSTAGLDQYVNEIETAANGTTVDACASLPEACSAYIQAIADAIPQN